MSGVAGWLMALALWSGSPAGDPQPPNRAQGEQAPESVGELAFRAAVAAFDAREFARAAELFEIAYRVSKAPAILFDLGQAYRGLGDCRAALDAYDRFLLAAEPADPLRERVQARRAEVQGCTRPARPVVTTTAPAPPPIVTRAPAPVELRGTASPSQRGARLRTGCTAAAATTGTVGLIGLGLGVKSWFVARDVEGRNAWDTQAQNADARGKAYADVSASLLLTSGVTAAITAATCWLGWVAYR